MFVRQIPPRQSKPEQQSEFASHAKYSPTQQQPLVQALPSQQSSFSLHTPPLGRQQFVSLKSKEEAQLVRPPFWQHWLLSGSQLCWRGKQP